MLLMRPSRHDDHDEILGIARQAGIGMSSLPADSHVLEQKIARSVASFAGRPEHPQDEAFLLVLEDTEASRIVGTASLVAHVGVRRPFNSYKLSTLVQASEKLGIYSLNRVLHMVNDYTGATDIGGLFLIPEYRRDGIGRFLSRSRHLMLAEFPYLFSDTVIAEIRGVQNIKGESPFYNNLAKFFFLMDFKRCDFTYATQGGQFIADLMPKYPIYVKLLAQEAQTVIGVPLDASLPAKRMLEAEGFSYEGYVDVFDAGPTLQCERDQIRTVRCSQRARVVGVEKSVEAPLAMVCNTALEYYALVRAPVRQTEEGVVISQEAAGYLGVSVGSDIRWVV